jgi:hypothetical protein
MAEAYRVSNPEIQERIDRLVALSRIHRERDNLRYELARVNAKLKRIPANPGRLQEQRAYRLKCRATHLSALLSQLPLLI